MVVAGGEALKDSYLSVCAASWYSPHHVCQLSFRQAALEHCFFWNISNLLMITHLLNMSLALF